MRCQFCLWFRCVCIDFFTTASRKLKISCKYQSRKMSGNNSGKGKKDDDEFDFGGFLGAIGAIAAIGYGAYQIYDTIQEEKKKASRTQVVSDFGGHSNQRTSHQNQLPTYNNQLATIHSWISKEVTGYIYIEDYEDWTPKCDDFIRRARMIGAVGLDTEFKPLPGLTYPPASLLQLANHQGECLLVRLNRPNSIPTQLQNFLQDERVIKVGLGVQADQERIYRTTNVSVKGWIDLDHLDIHGGKKLKDLAQEYLNIEMRKRKTYDWNALTYTEEQKLYAARDAHVSLRLLLHFAFEIIRDAPRSSSAEDILKSHIRTLCEDVIETKIDRSRLLLLNQ